MLTIAPVVPPSGLWRTRRQRGLDVTQKFQRQTELHRLGWANAHGQWGTNCPYLGARGGTQPDLKSQISNLKFQTGRFGRGLGLGQVLAQKLVDQRQAGGFSKRGPTVSRSVHHFKDHRKL